MGRGGATYNDLATLFESCGWALVFFGRLRFGLEAGLFVQFLNGHLMDGWFLWTEKRIFVCFVLERERREHGNKCKAKSVGFGILKRGATARE